MVTATLNENVLDEIHGIWDDDEVFTQYRVTLTFVDRVMGGVPQKPEIIEGWLKQRIAEDDDGEIKLMMRKTLEELGVEVDVNMTRDDLYAAARVVAAEQHGNTFRRDANGMFLASYQIKAALKENTNILYAGDRWGKTKKGPKSYLAERVFVDEEHIYLGRDKADGVHLQIGHVTGPQGPRSTLTYYDYVQQPTISFTLSSVEDCIASDQWKRILVLMQRNGIGALRSLGHGQFRVTAFDKL